MAWLISSMAVATGRPRGAGSLSKITCGRKWEIFRELFFEEKWNNGAGLLFKITWQRKFEIFHELFLFWRKKNNSSLSKITWKTYEIFRELFLFEEKKQRWDRVVVENNLKKKVGNILWTFSFWRKKQQWGTITGSPRFFQKAKSWQTVLKFLTYIFEYRQEPYH